MSIVCKTSSASSGTKKQKAQKQNTADKTQESSRVNWHEAATCAIRIELRDFEEFLEFYTEYALGRNSYRIDLLVVKMLTGRPIPKNIAHIFKTYNLFEVKGIQSSITANVYYKTIGYAGLFLDKINSPKQQYSSPDISITFLGFHYPRKLVKLLKKKAGFAIEKTSQGIYYINNEMFDIQIIVIPELPPEENLYLCSLVNNLQDVSMANRLAEDYGKHREQEIYNKYLHQLSIANLKTKGEKPMVCEGLLNLYGTSSKELIEQGKKESEDYYIPKLNELSAKNEQLALSNEQQASFIKQLTSQIDRLESLIKQHKISYD